MLRDGKWHAHIPTCIVDFTSQECNHGRKHNDWCTFLGFALPDDTSQCGKDWTFLASWERPSLLPSVNKINQVQNQIKFQNVLTLQAYNSNGPHKDWGSRADMQSHTHSNPSPTSAPSTVTVKVNARKGIMHKIWTKSYILMDVLSVAWLEIHWGVTVCFSSISLPCSCKCRMIEACVVVK